MNADTDMQQTTQVDCSTKIDGKSHKTHLTINWAGMTPRDLQQIAEGRIVIRFQDENRRLLQVPEENMTLSAVDFRVGTRRAITKPLTPEEALAKLSPEQLQALLQSKGLA